MPGTLALSESAVALLRFRVKGYRMKVTDSSLEAFRELVAAGINGAGAWRGWQPRGRLPIHRGWLAATAGTAQRGRGTDRAGAVRAARREQSFEGGQGSYCAVGWLVIGR